MARRPLADVADEPFAAAEIRRLEELLAPGGRAGGRRRPRRRTAREVLAELERLMEEHPLRERLHAQRMLALYRSGRQAEALEAYVAARRRLVDDIGVEPGAELRELHQTILSQAAAAPSIRDPARRAPLPDDGPITRRRRRGGGSEPRSSAALLLIRGAAVLAVSRLTGNRPPRRGSTRTRSG